MQEHLRFNPNGSFAGLYRLDTSLATGDRWERIDRVIYEWAKIHPQEVRECIEDATRERNEALTKWGSTLGKTMRKGIKIPPGLLFALQQIEPDLFEDKQLFHGFMKRYKAFRTCHTT
jgi:hypothetical protein